MTPQLPSVQDMKNHTTPRTLAECDFSIGYPSTSNHQRDKRIDRLCAIGTIAICAGIGILLAWRG